MKIHLKKVKARPGGDCHSITGELCYFEQIRQQGEDYDCGTGINYKLGVGFVCIKENIVYTKVKRQK